MSAPLSLGTTGTIFVYRLRVLLKISGGKEFILMRVISFRYRESHMQRLGLLVAACIVLSVGVWGQAPAQGSQGQGSTASSGETGKKPASGKHHHKHHHHKKQTGSKQ